MWKALMRKGTIPVQKRVVARVCDDAIRSALAFLFLNYDVELISWRAKRITYNGKSIDFPPLLGLKGQVQIYCDYITLYEGQEPSICQRLLGRTRFLQLVNMFMKG